MKTKLLKSAFLAALVIGSAGAAKAVTITGTNNDLILGFEVTDGTGAGASTDFEYDLGPASQFTSTASITFTNLALDLETDYGTSGNPPTLYTARTDLQWSVNGYGGTVGNATLYVTSPNNDFVFAQNGSNAQSGPASELSAQASGVVGSASVADNSKAVNIPAAQENSYSSEEGNTDNNSGKSEAYDYYTSDPENIVSATSNETSDLYVLPPTGDGKAQDVGTFTLGPDGSFSFEGSAVPEPSTYAMMLIGAGLLFGMHRFRKNLGV